jgi:hypothetical protein
MAAAVCWFGSLSEAPVRFTCLDEQFGSRRPPGLHSAENWRLANVEPESEFVIEKRSSGT